MRTCQVAALPVPNRPRNAFHFLCQKLDRAEGGASWVAINLPPPSGEFPWLNAPHPSAPSVTGELLPDQAWGWATPVSHSIFIITFK